MKNLIIIGARGSGRELFNYAQDCKESGKEWKVTGFLDDKKDALDGFEGYPPILDSVENYRPLADDVFMCALGDGGFKKKYAEMILAKGGKFINVIHPSANLSKKIKMGYGCFIMPNAIVSNDCRIGNFVTLQPSVGIGHDVALGDFCTVNSFVFMGGFAKAGNLVTIFPHASILPRVTIGDGATVGAGSVVLKNVKAGVTVFGNPAREIS